MQVLVEGLALAAFQRIRDFSKNPLAASINAYVMQDEARHVAFGRTALRGFYPQLTEAERKEREDFVIEACYMMRDRFDQKEVWGRLGLPEEECAKAVRESETMRQFRQRLFSRIVPTVKDIGLWSPRVQSAFADMGAIEFANVDVEAQFAQDQKIAEEFDARRVVMASIGAVQSGSGALKSCRGPGRRALPLPGFSRAACWLHRLESSGLAGVESRGHLLRRPA
ncbi:diiron oxygenase [Cupriavidus basilensis]